MVVVSYPRLSESGSWNRIVYKVPFLCRPSALPLCAVCLFLLIDCDRGWSLAIQRRNLTRNTLCSCTLAAIRSDLFLFAHASTYVFFSILRLSSTSSGMSVVLCRQQAAQAYHAHRDPMPSQAQLESNWRRKSVGEDRGRWLCWAIMGVYERWIHKVAKLRRRQAYVMFTGICLTTKEQRHLHHLACCLKCQTQAIPFTSFRKLQYRSTEGTYCCKCSTVYTDFL